MEFGFKKISNQGYQKSKCNSKHEYCGERRRVATRCCGVFQLFVLFLPRLRMAKYWTIMLMWCQKRHECKLLRYFKVTVTKLAYC